MHWGKTFTRYELRDDSVRAIFADGTHADGDILVGADGSNSRVRHQRLPELQRQELGIVNIAGRVPLTGAWRRRCPPNSSTAASTTSSPPGPGGCSCPPGPATDARRDGASRYVVWAWAAAETSYPHGVRDLDGARLKRLVTERIADWCGPLRTLVDATDPSTVTTVPLRTMPHLP